jgi:hypothetical protein
MTYITSMEYVNGLCKLTTVMNLAYGGFGFLCGFVCFILAIRQRDREFIGWSGIVMFSSVILAITMPLMLWAVERFG